MRIHQMHQLRFVVCALCIIAVCLVSAHTARSAPGLLPRSEVLQQVARFLSPPYYGTTSVNAVYDHQLPLGRAANEPPQFQGQVRHHDNTLRAENCGGGDARQCYSAHNGIDYDLEYELVRAAASGDVQYAGWRYPANHQAGEGLYVRIHHNNDYHTIYGHMSVLRVRTDDEDICETGEFSCILGISGNTGNSTGPHLHFELEPPNDNRSVNPYGWIDENHNDPWEDWSGLASHDVWLHHPSITNGDVYPSSAPLTAPPINENEPGTFTVDDGDTSFVENPAGCWTEDTQMGWAGDHRWRNVPAQNPGNCTATWNFPGTPGRYNIFVYVPNNHATTDAAQYTIRHTESPDRSWSKQSAWAAVDQSDYPNIYHSSWVYVGTYYFSNQYGTDYVRLESQPLDPVTDTMMAADAVRFAPVRYRVYLPLVMKRWPPIPYTPVLNAIYNPDNDGNYTVSWNPADLADTYTLQEATNASFVGAVTRYYGTGTAWSAANKAVDTYYYRVKARNSWGDSGWSNVEQTSVLPPAGWQTIAAQDFEGAFPGEWVVFDNNGATGGEYYWGKRTCRPYAGSYSGWGVGGGPDGAALACGSNYPDEAYSWLYYGPFDLEDAIAGELVFKLWLYSELYDDYVAYVASVDGVHFPGGYEVSGNTQGWDKVTLNLADVPNLGNLLGESQVWVAIIFRSNGSVNYAEGVYVDDVVIRECFRGPCPSGSRLTVGDGVVVEEISAPLILRR